MQLPILENDARSTDMVVNFGRYNHNISIADGEFYDMENMTTDYYPTLSPRKKRGYCRTFINLQGMLDKEDIVWVDDGYLYINGEIKGLSTGRLSTSGQKVMEKMGAYIVIFPDKVYYNVNTGESGKLDKKDTASNVVWFPNVGDNFNMPDTHTSAYYEAHPEAVKDGAYKMDYVLTKGASSTSAVSPDQAESSPLYRYSESLSGWIAVSNVNMALIYNATSSTSTEPFKKGDGVKVTARGTNWIYGEEGVTKTFNINNIAFPFEDEDGSRYCYATIAWAFGSWFGLELGATFPFVIQSGGVITIERTSPEMTHITEYGNRLWGCAKDGHEVYACKLGDPTNWQCFQGLSTDSWSATVGSDGEFTGAITYGGYPMFFKEHSMMKIAVASTGAHAYQEVAMNGVQKGSDKSLVELNGVLYYKGVSGIYAYTSSVPVLISEAFGGIRYKDGFAGGLKDKYYICLTDDSGVHHTFVYDTGKHLWAIEDTEPKHLFVTNKDELFFFDETDGRLESISGRPLTLGNSVSSVEEEEDFDWFVESGNIGYTDPNNKTVVRIAVRLTLELGTNVSLYLQYDSSGEWVYLCNMAGQGTKTFTIPVKPHRCDHFKYKIAGRGDCKIISVTKTVINGSDVNAHNY